MTTLKPVATVRAGRRAATDDDRAPSAPADRLAKGEHLRPVRGDREPAWAREIMAE